MQSNMNEEQIAKENDLKEKIVKYAGVHKYTSFFEIVTDEDAHLHVVIIDASMSNNPKSKLKKRQNLLMIHGLASSGLFFWRLFKNLSEDFVIYAIDIPGMGLSSRDEATMSDFEEFRDYFLNNIKKCIDKLGLEEFYLVGHSFGAYISSLFTLQHPNMVKALILLSPVGLSSNYAKIESTHIEDLIQSVSFSTKSPPTELFQSLGFISSFIFDFIFIKKLRYISDEDEVNTVKEFMKCLFFKKASTSENAIFSFFNKNLQAYQPLTAFSEYLKQKKILVIYGEEDWSPVSHAEDLKNLIKESIDIAFVKNGGHNMFVDNPDDTLKSIYNFFKKFHLL